MLVFVYGTLKRGGPNHPYLAKATFVQEDVIVGTMHDVGPFPAVTLNGYNRIEGEVWDCDVHTVARLDHLEGVYEGLYKVSHIQTVGGLYVRVYEAAHPWLTCGPVIPSGVWEV